MVTLRPIRRGRTGGSARTGVPSSLPLSRSGYRSTGTRWVSPAVLDRPPRDRQGRSGANEDSTGADVRASTCVGKFGHVVGGLAPAQEKVAPVDAGKVPQRALAVAQHPAVDWKPRWAIVRRASPLEAARPVRTRSATGSSRSVSATAVQPTSRRTTAKAPAEAASGSPPKSTPAASSAAAAASGPCTSSVSSPASARWARRCSGATLWALIRLLHLVQWPQAEPPKVPTDLRRPPPAPRTGGTGTARSCPGRATPHPRRSCPSWRRPGG